MNECERKGMAGNPPKIKDGFSEKVASKPWLSKNTIDVLLDKSAFHFYSDACNSCGYVMKRTDHYWMQPEGLRFCNGCYNTFVLPGYQKKEPESTDLEKEIVKIWDEYEGFKRSNEGEPVSLAEKRKPFKWSDCYINGDSPPGDPLENYIRSADVTNAFVPYFGYRNPTGIPCPQSEPEHTHCATFEFPNGDIVEIPPPDEKDGWAFSNSLEAKWPHHHWLALFHYQREQIANPKHESGKMIMHEYLKRIKTENPRIIKTCTFIKCIQVEADPQIPETYDAVKNFPLLSGYGLNR